eukprot:2454352-Rhodomonas_salina.1
MDCTAVTTGSGPKRRRMTRNAPATRTRRPATPPAIPPMRAALLDDEASDDLEFESTWPHATLEQSKIGTS